MVITTKVVIIGAGACGLQCAHKLVIEYQVPPKDIVILEGRNRIGGRIHTTHETVIDENKQVVQFAVDHGACWVHGTGSGSAAWNRGLAPTTNTTFATTTCQQGDSSENNINPILPLLAQARSTPVDRQLDFVFQGNPWMRPKTIVQDQSKLALFVNGAVLPANSPVAERALQNHFDLLQRLSSIGQQLMENGFGMQTIHQSVKQTIEQLPCAHGDQAGEPTGDHENLSEFYMHLLECWYGTSVKNLPLCEFVNGNDEKYGGTGDYDAQYSAVGDFEGPHCMVKNGMETLLEPLLRNGVRDRIQMNEEVTKIQSVGDQLIVVETATGQQIQADVCVSTLPVECLKVAIHDGMFQPPLCIEKEKAISKMKMSSYKKVMLTFDRIFWPVQEPFIGLVYPHRYQQSPLGKFLLLNNLWAYKSIPCIEAILFGDSGSWAVGKSDDEISDVILDFMKVSMGLQDDLRQICSQVHVTRWEEDRFTRGAYSSMSVGVSIRHVEELRRPEYNGRLLLAGEGTVLEYEGSVHAALFSGNETADHVFSRLSTSAPSQCHNIQSILAKAAVQPDHRLLERTSDGSLSSLSCI